MGNMEEIDKEVKQAKQMLSDAAGEKTQEADAAKRKFEQFLHGGQLEIAKSATRQAEELREEARKLGESYDALEAAVKELRQATERLKPEETEHAKAEIEEALAVLLGKLKDCQGQTQSTVEATRTHLAEQLGPIIKKGSADYTQLPFGIGASRVEKWTADLVKSNNTLGNWLSSVAGECRQAADQVRTTATADAAQAEGAKTVAQAEPQPQQNAIERRREMLGL